MNAHVIYEARDLWMLIYLLIKSAPLVYSSFAFCNNRVQSTYTKYIFFACIYHMSIVHEYCGSLRAGLMYGVRLYCIHECAMCVCLARQILS